MSPLLMRRRAMIAAAAVPAIRAIRDVQAYHRVPAHARVAVLAEIAGAAATLARQLAAASHVDAKHAAVLVTDPADVLAVLGRGRWLPTMHRPILTIPHSATPVETTNTARAVQQRRIAATRITGGQLPLFSDDLASPRLRAGDR